MSGIIVMNKFPFEKKQEIIELSLSGKRIEELGRIFNIHPLTLKRWLKRYKLSNYKGLDLS